MIPAGSAGPAQVLLPTRLIASGEGYAMVRRRGAGAPFIITEEQWAEALEEGK